MTDHDLSKWTILSLILTAATLIVGLSNNEPYHLCIAGIEMK